MITAKCNTLECLIGLMSTGFTTLPMVYLTEIINTQELSVVKYMVSTLLGSVSPPYSTQFQANMRALLSIDSCLGAIAAMSSDNSSNIGPFSLNEEKKEKLKYLMETGSEGESKGTTGISE